MTRKKLVKMGISRAKGKASVVRCGPVMAAICLLSATASGQISSLSYTGTLASPQSAFEVTFTLSAPDTVTFRTWGFGGGTNAAGNIIPAGGFDPLIALFRGLPVSATIYVDGSGNPLADADNLLNAPWSFAGNCPAAGTVAIGANKDCGDDQMSVALPAGTYTLVLTDGNYQPGAIYAGGALTEPFVDFTGGGPQFQTCDPSANACINPNSHYAVDITSDKADLQGECGVNQNGNINVASVQLTINQVLGITLVVNDFNGDGKVNVVDVQIDINSALGSGCSAK
jgi:hypothetical protein